jgi:hypothetical protein
LRAGNDALAIGVRLTPDLLESKSRPFVRRLDNCGNPGGWMSVVIEQRIATLLGNLGLLPFFVLALLCWPWSGPLGCSRPGRGVHLGFHWGLALASRMTSRVETRLADAVTAAH